MRVVPHPTIKAMSGKILGEHSKTHVRTNRNGTVFICRNPRQKKAPTEAQIATHERMRKASILLHEIKEDSDRLGLYKRRFLTQVRYTRLNDYILHELFTDPESELNMGN